MTQPAPSTDLDLRLVRYFVAVAEEGHFGRAALELGLAQPSLSRQIALLERRLGARLLDRTPQGSHLTDAGATFLPLARALLRSGEQAISRTRAAAEPSRIVIGYTTHIFVTSAVRELRRQQPDASVQTVHLDWADRSPALFDHRVDAIVTRLPLATARLNITVLCEEPRVLLVSRDHRLSARASVSLDDIADEPLPRLSDPEWNAFWRIDPRPDGRRAPDGPLVRTLEDKLELVATGQAVTISAGSSASNLRPDLVAIPLDGVEPGHVVLATRAGEHGRLVGAFQEIAQRCFRTAGEPQA